MKKILLFMILGSLNYSCFAQLTNLVARNEKAIFQIFSYDEFGSPSSLGTGFFISPDGTAVTNLHVLEESKFAYIRDYKGDYYQIEKINRICKECDIAEFQIITSNKTFDKLNVSYEIPPKGSEIFVIGNPEGYESTVSQGIISSIRDQNNSKIIQISAPISPGSSGSPIMDMSGNVIGIATFGHISGQNLNFGYWIGCFDKLIDNKEYNISNDQTGNLFIINKICETEPNLILNSIEVTEKNTIVNMSFTNTSLAFGDGAYIYTSIGIKGKSFYIEDKSSGKKFNLYDASIGTSPKSPTKLILGETKRFKLFFPAINKANMINIYEGTEEANWSFQNINLSEHKTLNYSSTSFFDDFYFQTGLSFLATKQFDKAYSIIKEYAATNNENDYAHNLAGIISYILGNYLDAFLHIRKALEINPTNDNYYFNLYFLNKNSNNLDEALKNISSAIQLNEKQPEYYVYRAYIHYDNESWKLAIEDFNKFLESDREPNYDIYFRRAVSKLWLNDKSACPDLEKAFQICDEGENKKFISDTYNKYCK